MNIGDEKILIFNSINIDEKEKINSSKNMKNIYYLVNDFKILNKTSKKELLELLDSSDFKKNQNLKEKSEIIYFTLDKIENINYSKTNITMFDKINQINFDLYMNINFDIYINDDDKYIKHMLNSKNKYSNLITKNVIYEIDKLFLSEILLFLLKNNISVLDLQYNIQKLKEELTELLNKSFLDNGYIIKIMDIEIKFIESHNNKAIFKTKKVEYEYKNIKNEYLLEQLLSNNNKIYYGGHQ